VFLCGLTKARSNATPPAAKGTRLTQGTPFFARGDKKIEPVCARIKKEASKQSFKNPLLHQQREKYCERDPLNFVHAGRVGKMRALFDRGPSSEQQMKTRHL
jgi:hypothetical protein